MQGKVDRSLFLCTQQPVQTSTVNISCDPSFACSGFTRIDCSFATPSGSHYFGLCIPIASLRQTQANTALRLRVALRILRPLPPRLPLLHHQTRRTRPCLLSFPVIRFSAPLLLILPPATRLSPRSSLSSTNYRNTSV
jgi:hypothetical protein